MYNPSDASSGHCPPPRNGSSHGERAATPEPRKLVLASRTGPQYWTLSAILRPNDPIEVPVEIWRLPPHKVRLADLQMLVNDGFRWIIYSYSLDVYYKNDDKALGLVEGVEGQGDLYGLRDGLIWSIELRTTDADRSPLEGWQSRGLSFTPDAFAASERHYSSDVLYDTAFNLPVFNVSVPAIRDGRSDTAILDGSSVTKITDLLTPQLSL